MTSGNGKRAALLSVSDRTGLEEFARALDSLGYVLLTTSGTAKFLTSVGITSMLVEEYTGQKEILDGRVKTLHPKIHAGLLARRDDAAHMKQLSDEGIMPIDVAAVNLYPFVQNLTTANADNPARMIEFVDVGGPTMIRAAAKNHASVFPVIDPADYARVAEMLRNKVSVEESLALRRALAVKVFTQLAYDSLEIAKYFSSVGQQEAFPPIHGVVLERQQGLRYGENPHQQALFYKAVGSPESRWKQLHGKELSYNNLLDFDAALRVIKEFPSSTATAVIMKHLNPCGAAIADSLQDALKKAKRCDPRSHFGGVIAFNQTVSAAVAEDVKEDFAEIVIAPAFDDAALAILQRSKNLRIMTYDAAEGRGPEIRRAAGGYLLQRGDEGVSNVASLEVVSKRAPTAQELKDLQFAWMLCSHVKSNAITIAKEGMLVGVGAGQMSRVDSVELALAKAKRHEHDLQGAVAASDAFFPFTDSVETLAAQGITAVIAPSGAKRDSDVVETANRLNVALVFAPDRHFRH
ncbi:MAG: bifunctional phosphoribosylaminoimidazolecarboxamide formyltransferase/IMP cyclohydrolase [Deltaproteobacteria bacterium]|nr:bifunctional phosphoribosylaminoimidazolecarboxamide formyltransferase/IMP cyclohydrolase [Deltaproteobacteria bacterium]